MSTAEQLAQSSAQHTPGPWQYANGVVDAPINGTSSPTVICEGIRARERGFGPLAERQAIADADGHLIAAAPELLAALRDAQGIYDNGSHADMHAVASDMVAVIRAAIAKAEGAV